MADQKSALVGRWQLPARVIEQLLPDCAHQWRQDNPKADRPTFEEAEKITKELLTAPDFPRNPRILPRIAWAERNWPRLAASMRKTLDRFPESSEPENLAWEFFSARWIRQEPDLALQTYFIPQAKSDPDYWEALRLITARYLEKDRWPPDALVEWALVVFGRKQTKPGQRRGRSRNSFGLPPILWTRTA